MIFKDSLHLLLLLFNLIRTTSNSDTITLALTNPSPTLSCSEDQFACSDGLKCISNEYLCDGDADCNDASDESESACIECGTDPSKFTCELYGNEVCHDMCYKCDGYNDCDDLSDELVSVCPNCAADP